MDRLSVLKENEYFKNLDMSYCYDSLTGILNRQTMTSYVKWLIDHSRPFSFFFVDIDNFKNVNDTYGHLVGDEVIAQSAKYFVKVAGNRGVVTRYGGDEFVIIFDGVTDYNDVWRYGHEIDKRIGEIKFEGIPNLAITVSIGIARFPINAASFEELTGVADKALYRAKTKGRNCFIIYLPEKHAHISLKKERERTLTTMQLCFNIFSAMTACGEDVSLAINTVFKSLVSYYMYDHICVEGRDGLNFSVCYALSEQKIFRHVPYQVIDALINAAGYACFNHATSVEDKAYSQISNEYAEQKISSGLICKISAYGKDYGFIRLDTCNTVRIWQSEEIAHLMTVANTIGLLLHYQKKTLEDLPTMPPVEVGKR